MQTRRFMRSLSSIKFTFFVAITLAVLIGVSEVVGQVASDDEKLAEKLEEFERTKNQPTMDPTAIAQKDASQQAAIAAFQGVYKDWLEDFKKSGVDPRTLAWGELGGLYETSPETVDAAVRESRLVISGVATSVDFRAGGSLPQTVVTFKVDEVLKGDVGGTIQLVFGGGPMPGPEIQNFEDARIGYWAVEPLLLPGDEAILLLKDYRGNETGLAPQAWTGVNKIENGSVKANLNVGEQVQDLSSSKLRSEFHGKTKAELLSLLRAAIARN